MLRVLSYIITFLAGSAITFLLHCCVIMAKDSDNK